MQDFTARSEQILKGLGTMEGFMQMLRKRLNPVTLKPTTEETEVQAAMDAARVKCGGNVPPALRIYLRTGYSQKQLQDIQEIIEENRGMLLAVAGKRPFVGISSAGTLGAGKSTGVMQVACETFQVNTNPEDWNEVTLRAVSRKLEEAGIAFVSTDRSAALQLAEKWGMRTDGPHFYLLARAATMIISNQKMMDAMALKVPFVHDTIMSNPSNMRFAVEQCGMESVIVLMMTAPSEIAEQAIANRIADGFFQSLPESVEPQRLIFNNNIPAIKQLIDNSGANSKIIFALRDDARGEKILAGGYDRRGLGTYPKRWEQMTGLLPQLAIFEPATPTPAPTPPRHHRRARR